MLSGGQAECGYDWWWHSFTAYHEKTKEAKPFFIEFFLCNPAIGEDEPVFGQLPANKKRGRRPSYLMVKAGAWGEDAAQLHRFFGWKEIRVEMGVPFFVGAGDCYLDEKRTRGSVTVTKAQAKEHQEYMCQAG